MATTTKDDAEAPETTQTTQTTQRQRPNRIEIMADMRKGAGQVANILAVVVTVAASVFATILALHVVFVLFKATPTNSIVMHINTWAHDFAGPFRTLWSVLLPQAVPVLIAVAIFHVVYSWNDFFGPLIYLSSSPDLQTLAVGLARFSGARVAQDPGLIQAGTILTLIIPVALFVVFQRVFVRGIVITGVEK